MRSHVIGNDYSRDFPEQLSDIETGKIENNEENIIYFPDSSGYLLINGMI